jgi:hypothetical protein
MTILAQARGMRYAVGTNLKGRGGGATWTLLLPSLDIGAAGVVGRATPGELEALHRLAHREVSAPGTDGLTGLGERRLDLILVGRGGGELVRRTGGVRALGDHLAPTGAVYGEFHGGERGLAESWEGAAARLAVWPAFGPARVFVPSADHHTIEQLGALGFLPARGSAGPMRRILNRLAELRAGGHRTRRWAELAVGPAIASVGPPAYVVEIARAAGVEIEAAPWALAAPGDYASQKVLLLLFGPTDRNPWTIVKLGADPAHAGRLRNEAAVLAHLGKLDLPDGMVPTLRFAGEHAGRGVVGQEWIRGRAFTSASDARIDSPQLAAAVAGLTSLAATSIERLPAAGVGAALRDLFDRFRQIHDLPAEETDYLDAQVRAVEDHPGTLPVICQHGDPGAWNLLVDEAGRVAFLDWESGERHGLPLWDLAHFQCSFGAWAARREGARRRLAASVRHFATPTPLQARFTAQIADLAAVVELPRPMIRPLFYTCWMHRTLKEATRRTPATLDRGLYRRLLRELIRRRDEPAMRRLLADES